MIYEPILIDLHIQQANASRKKLLFSVLAQETQCISPTSRLLFNRFELVEIKFILNNSLRINLCTYGKTLRLPFINSVNTSNVFK